MRGRHLLVGLATAAVLLGSAAPATAGVRGDEAPPGETAPTRPPATSSPDRTSPPATDVLVRPDPISPTTTPTPRRVDAPPVAPRPTDPPPPTDAPRPDRPRSETTAPPPTDAPVRPDVDPPPTTRTGEPRPVPPTPTTRPDDPGPRPDCPTGAAHARCIHRWCTRLLAAGLDDPGSHVTERCRRWLACHRHPDRCDRPDDIRPPDCDDAPSHLRCVYRWCRRVVSAVDETSDSTIPQRCRRWLNCVTHPPADARRWCGVWLATHRMLA